MAHWPMHRANKDIIREQNDSLRGYQYHRLSNPKGWLIYVDFVDTD